MNKDPIVIVSATRTPMGSMLGELSSLSASQLGAATLAETTKRAGISAEIIDEVIMGCVLSAGQGQAPARQAALAAGLSQATPCTTINKVCGSGLQAVILAHDSLIAGSNQVMLVGGMESMSKAPYLLPNARAGMRFGHGEMLDHMKLDGLEDAYDKGLAMGVYADATAEKYNFTREQQDAFAIESLTRAKRANEDGSFEAETVAITVKTRKGETQIIHDEQPYKSDVKKIPNLRPAFKEGGSVTAANSSSISDGAASLLLMPLSVAEKHGLTPLVKIVGHSRFAQAPEWFTTSPVSALKNLMQKLDWQEKDVDLFEINEAFAVVTMAAMHDLKLPHQKVNVNGGACALGHPIGASGARILVTLIHALKQRKLKTGMASLCIGGGEAVAIAVESMA